MSAGQTLRAIDLYSGVGGWSLGLRLAGIEVVASYERWAPANQTNFKNNKHPSHTVDIRRLEESDLPTDVDIIVGSPPCTQFSLSNRGGSGDIEDGLTDVEKFLSIVDHVRPKFWVMENVPRSKPFLEAALKNGGRLARFQHLMPQLEIFNLDDFGLPQRRRRCLVGNMNFALLKSYAGKAKNCTLGDVIEALKGEEICDPLFGLKIPHKELFDHDVEASLNEEETRINRAGKTSHTVYNSMPFPDPLNRSVRTITATCTRVSRESVIVEDPENSGAFRRLTVRERACLQGFPVNFQFYGQSYASKIKMVGNALPPVFSYWVGNALRLAAPDDVFSLSSHIEKLHTPLIMPEITTLDRAGKTYPWDRNFRFAIPQLQLKSGVRFELINRFESGHPGWEVDFIFGTSKDILSLKLDLTLFNRLRANIPNNMLSAVTDELDSLSEFLHSVDMARMQDVWSHRGPGGTRPFTLLDRLGTAGAALIQAAGPDMAAQLRTEIETTLEVQFGSEFDKMAGVAKLLRNYPLIYAGLLVGSITNGLFTSNSDGIERRHSLP